MTHNCPKHEPSRYCYNRCGCRCHDCLTAALQYQSNYRRQKAYKRPLPGQLIPRQETEQARAKLQALVALGWSMTQIAKHMGVVQSSAQDMINGCRLFQRQTLPVIDAVYDRLSMRLPPTTTRWERRSVTLAKGVARRNKWVPPLELETQGLPAIGDDYIDHAAVVRRLAGEKTIRLSKAEQYEAWLRWPASRGRNEFERVTGISSDRMIDYGREHEALEVA